MGTVLRSSLDLIVLAIRDRLASVLRMEGSVQIIDAEEDFEDTIAEQYVCIWPGDESPVESIIQGGGRVDGRLAATIRVWLRTRNALDETGSAEAWLTDPVRGHLVWRAALWDALLTFLPADESGNGLCVQPLWPRGSTTPKRRKGQREWGESVLSVLAVYEINCDQLYQ